MVWNKAAAVILAGGNTDFCSMLARICKMKVRVSRKSFNQRSLYHLVIDSICGSRDPFYAWKWGSVSFKDRSSAVSIPFELSNPKPPCKFVE